MIARTKNQKRVVKLNDRIKPIGVQMTRWAENNILKKRGTRNKFNFIHCFECGHKWRSDTLVSWHDELVDPECPSCKHTLKIESTNKRSADKKQEFTHVTTIGEYQLIRTFQITGTYKCKEKAKYCITEICRVFINEKGKREVVGRNSGGYGYYQNYWAGDLELRSRDSIDEKYALQGKLFPKWKLQDFVIQKGFNAYSYEKSEYTVSAFLYTLFSNPNAETVLKDDRLKLFDRFMYEPKTMKKYWPTIKICIRNNYDMINISSYFDMISSLKFFNKDLRNPKYVCPKDFHEAHDYWTGRESKVLKKRRSDAQRLRDWEMMQKEKRQVSEYADRMKAYSKLSFDFGDLKIFPFMTVEDVRIAGDLMKHCIYSTSSYWTNTDNLLFGTFYKGKLIETTQYSLNEKRCKHSYGPCNQESRFHKKIVETLNDAKIKIASCTKKKRNVKKKERILEVA